MKRTDTPYLDRIDVIGSNEDASIDDANKRSIQRNTTPSLHENVELDPITLHSENIDILYKETKEHKSIVKGVLINVFILCFVFLIAIIMIAFLPPNNDNMVAFMSFAATVRLYRSFGTIISAIYCFEVINNLFYQLVDKTTTNIQNIFERIG
jgi:hypothetical protein